jgi:diacylglycerol kinase (ATP)
MGTPVRRSTFQLAVRLRSSKCLHQEKCPRPRRPNIRWSAIVRRTRNHSSIRLTVKIAVIHNPNAFRGEVDSSELCRLFERAGHHVAYVSIEEPNWQRVLSPEIARAIIVGGDGTVELVTPFLKGTPFSILPIGTANNVAECLKQTSTAEVLASQLGQAEVRHLDLGKVVQANENNFFLECIGMGAFVDLILAMRDWPKKQKMEQAASRREKFAHAIEELQTISRASEGTLLELKIDDDLLSDRFLMIAAMNMELIGPRLCVAPGADPSDGFLDLVLVREEDRGNLCRWLEDQLRGRKNAANLERRRCQRLKICASDIAPVHLDSRLIPRPEFPLVVELEPAALRYSVQKAPVLPVSYTSEVS